MTSKTISGSLTHGVTLTTATYNYNPLYVTETINTATGDGVNGDNTQAWTIGNTGTIKATAGNGVNLLNGGRVTNGASGATSALISGFNDGIYVFAPTAPGTITNFATVVGGSNGVGVFLNGYGNIANGAPTITTALVTSGYIAVEIENQPGTVTNFGTIMGTASGGAVRLDGGGLINGGSAATHALINGNAGVAVYNTGKSLTLTNYGTITVTGSLGRPAVRLDPVTTPNSITNFGTISGNLATGIYMRTSGVITNGASGASTALIAGAPIGVWITGGTGTVTNFGTIEGTGSPGFGVYLAAGGSVSNGASGSTSGLIEGKLGVLISGGSGSVANFGSIVAAGSYGVILDSGGIVTNGASGAGTALIEGATGIAIKGGSGTVINFASIEGTGGFGVGVYLAGGGSVSNGASGSASGLIKGLFYGVEISGNSGTVTNFGTITSPGGNSGVYTALGGLVTNGASGATTARIDGNFGVDVARLGGSATVANFGTIQGIAGDDAVRVGGTAGLVTNGTSGSTAALIQGGIGVSFGGSGGSVVNFGTILATAPSAAIAVQMLGTGGTVTNFGTIAGTVVQTVVVSGVVSLDGGNLTNGGTNASGALINGGSGVAVFKFQTLTNYGTITGGTRAVADPIFGTINNFGTIKSIGNLAVYLQGGGIVTNGASGSTAALIVGSQAGIGILGSLGGTVSNFGTIEGITHINGKGDGIGIDLTAGAGVFTNAGLIEGYGFGIYFRPAAFAASGTVTNSGTIAGTGPQGMGVLFASAASTLTNSGTIVGTGGTAVQFGTANNRLILAPGAVFQGKVIGGAGASVNTMELAAGPATGTLSGFGTSFTNFGVLTVDAGASWRFTSNTIGSGVTLTNSGRLSNAGPSGVIDTAVTLTAGAYLYNQAGGIINVAATAVKAIGSAATILNRGSIQGTTGPAMYLTAAGSIYNGGVITSAATAIKATGSAAIANLYKIQGTTGPAIYLAAGGSINNYPGAVIASAATAIKATGSAATIVNFGSIQGTSSPGIYLAAGGSVTNGPAGITPLIAGYDGIVVRNAPGTVTNYGMITGSGIFDSGVALDGGGTLNNRGTIAATGSQSYAVFILGGSLTNGASGATGAVITGGGKDGVRLAGAGTITNFGTIAATNTAVGIGISFSGGNADTLVNAGTIIGAGGTAVSFSSGNDRLIVQPGAVFSGIVNAGAGNNSLELGSAASTGTLSGLGTSITNFTAIQFDSGARWLLGGNTAGLTAGTIGGFTIGDTIDLTGFVAVSETFSNNALVLTNSVSNHVTLGIQGSFSTSNFIITPDGSGGTDVALASSPPNDFYGNGFSDILWQNTDGTAAIWQMNGATVTAAPVIANPGASWKAVGGGDFNRDGYADILWQNTDGTVAIWEMNGATVVAAPVIANPGASWKAIGSGDFNRDYYSDILWQNTDGTVAIWEMNGATVIAAPVIGNPGASWKTIGSGDFNRDGYSDILWQNTNGAVAIWEMNGATVVAAPVIGNPGTSWKAIGTGDFNRDGYSDILWQNTDGSVAIWEMNGANVIAAPVIGNPGASWKAIGAGDFNRDGYYDILWQNTNGAVAIWEMNGATVIAAPVIGNPGTSWHPILGSGSSTIGNGSSGAASASSAAAAAASSSPPPATGNGSDLVDLLVNTPQLAPQASDAQGATVAVPTRTASQGYSMANDSGYAGSFAVASTSSVDLIPKTFSPSSMSAARSSPDNYYNFISAVRANDFYSGGFSNGFSDILWQNTDGTVAIWEMNGATVVAAPVIANPGASWTAIGSGGFNHDGYSDILWQNTDGTVAIWEMNGANVIAAPVIGNPGASWQVIGAGDFNRDGHSDILWQNTDGAVAIWEMNGANVIAAPVIGNPGPSWKAIGVNGYSSILLQNTDGTVATWEVNGATVTAAPVIGNPGASWKAIGNGFGDILFQNTDGTVAIWDLNGQTVTAAPVIGNPGASWKAIGRGDFNGDWYPDILFQNTDGTVAIWEMKGDTAVGNPVIGNPGTSWHPIVGTGFFWYPYRSDATAASASAPSTATPSGGQPSDGAFGFNDVSDPVPAGSATAPSGGMPLPQSSSGSDPLLLTPGSTPLVDLTVPHGTVFG